MNKQYIIYSERLIEEKGGAVWSVPDPENPGERKEVKGHIISDYPEGGINTAKYGTVSHAWEGERGEAIKLRAIHPSHIVKDGIAIQPALPENNLNY